MSNTHYNQNTENKKFYEKSTVVYVTDQYACENLIKQGKKIATEKGNQLYVVNVSDAEPGKKPVDLNALEYLFQISRKHHAIMNVFYEKDILGVLIKTANEYGAENIILGAPRQATSVITKFLAAQEGRQCFMVHPTGEIVEIDTCHYSVADSVSSFAFESKEINYR